MPVSALVRRRNVEQGPRVLLVEGHPTVAAALARRLASVADVRVVAPPDLDRQTQGAVDLVVLDADHPAVWRLLEEGALRGPLLLATARAAAPLRAAVGGRHEVVEKEAVPGWVAAWARRGAPSAPGDPRDPPTAHRGAPDGATQG